MAKQVLAVNDDQFQLMCVSAQLMEAGYEVIEAEDGQQAVEKFESNPGIKAVILDINMPVMDGLEACAKISQLKDKTGSKAVLFAMSADDGPEMVDKVSKLPFQKLFKTIDVAALDLISSKIQ